MEGISIVMGILNENENIERMINTLGAMIEDHDLPEINELVFVDDGSDDGTVETVKKCSSATHPFRIRVIERGRKMGLVNAHITGCKYASNENVLIMDADFQHPPELIPKLVSEFRLGNDAVVGSRYIDGGGNSWAPIRGIVSRGAITISHLMIPSTRIVRDTMSGYFIMKKKYVVNLEPFERSYKLLLYALAMNDSLKIAEVPYVMIDRKSGDSKIVNKSLDFLVIYLSEVLKYVKVRRRNKNGLPKGKPHFTH